MEYIPTKTIVTRMKAPGSWFGGDYNMNIYKGCCHGCIYCDSRSECYGVKDFDRVRAKENALEIIRDDLRRKVRKGVVATGAMSDPYNPFEKELLLTRHALELISAYDFGVAIATKSPLVTRDIDVLREINNNSPVIVKMTVTSGDDDLSKIIEENVNPSSERFEAISRLAKEGIYTGVLMMPILPFIEDNEENILTIVEKAYESGAKFVFPAFGVTLRANQREHFYEKLDEKFPGLKQKYVKSYGNNYSCTSKNAKKLWNIFARKCDEYGLLYNMQKIISAYKTTKGPIQMKLF